MRTARLRILLALVRSEHRRFVEFRRASVESRAQLEDVISLDLGVRCGLAAVAALGILELAGVPTASYAVRIARFASGAIAPSRVIEFPAPALRR